MLIKFKLDGVERIIKQNGKNDFQAIDPNSKTKAPLGYYSNLGSAVSAHIRNAGSLTPQGKSEVIELKEYVQRHKQLFNQIMGLSVEDIPTATTEVEKPGPQKTISKDRQEKMQKGRIAKPTQETNPDDDDDDL